MKSALMLLHRKRPQFLAAVVSVFLCVCTEYVGLGVLRVQCAGCVSPACAFVCHPSPYLSPL